MDVRLIVLDGPKAGHGIKVKHKNFFIGRGEDCQLRARSGRISRRHCELIVSEASVLVRDLGGKNGTFINDKRVEGEQQLQSGDTLKVGPLRFKVVMSASAKVKKQPAKKDVKQAAPSSDPSSATSSGASAGDIDGWLSDDTAPPPSAEREPASPQRRRVDKGVSPEDEGADEAASSTDSDDSEAGDENDVSESKFGKLPPPPKTANSRDAADEMLRRMRRGS